jgi:Spy/CpxP family protein refolding chaperone
MKNLVLALSLALASGLAFAETETAEGDSPRGKPPGLPPHVLERLDLTEEQREEMRKIREAGGGKEEMRSVLTPEQQKQLQNPVGAGRKGEGGQRGSGNMDRLQRKLGLSDEQVAEMEKIREEGGSRQEMFDVLTEEQRNKLDQLRGQKRGAPQGPQGPRGEGGSA